MTKRIIWHISTFLIAQSNNRWPSFCLRKRDVNLEDFLRVLFNLNLDKTIILPFTDFWPLSGSGEAQRLGAITIKMKYGEIFIIKSFTPTQKLP